MCLLGGQDDRAKDLVPRRSRRNGPSLFPAALGFGGGGQHRRGEFFVQAEKMLHPFAVARERLLAIKPIDRLVERAMRLAQVRRHDIGIVEIGKRRAVVRRAGVEHGFRKLFEFCFGGFVELRLGEGIVDDANRIPVIAFQPTADVAQPGHVHARGDKGEV